ncbi:MAG: D-alanyl-D-alanine carboxypeptidase/D-alanyl-D-alanine-endopeptidase [Novosphingobium sp.]
MFRLLIPFALFALSAAASAEAPVAPAAAPVQTLQQQVEATLATAPQGARFGLLVVDENGSAVVSINPDQRFIPASNTKMFTTAAAYALLPNIDKPDTESGTQVWLVPGRQGSDVWLVGRGDARMSSAPDCKVNCLAELADAVAAKTKRVHDIGGDDSYWPDQRWVPGMSWNNIGTDSGTATSALNLDDNELRITVTPGPVGKPPVVTLPGFYQVRNEALTRDPAGPEEPLLVERAVHGQEIRLFGSIAVDAKPWTDRLGIDDPALYAAWSFKKLLEARGVKVTGKIKVHHRTLTYFDIPQPGHSYGEAVTSKGKPLATLIPQPLADDVVTINKVSQNLHAQVLFRRIGDLEGSGSEQWAAKALNGLFEKAGVPRKGYDFSDGSGMSTYNRVSPRAAVALLRWIDQQPWAAAWHASLPVAGKDGTLRRRLVGTPLEGNLTAKTGTLNATNALSGTFRTAKGQRFTFAFFANDVPDGVSVLPVMEAALLQIAAAN